MKSCSLETLKLSVELHQTLTAKDDHLSTVLFPMSVQHTKGHKHSSSPYVGPGFVKAHKASLDGTRQQRGLPQGRPWSNWSLVFWEHLNHWTWHLQQLSAALHRAFVPFQGRKWNLPRKSSSDFLEILWTLNWLLQASQGQSGWPLKKSLQFVSNLQPLFPPLSLWQCWQFLPRLSPL